ncbi:unnamed protein product [Amoebophrya sp. A25]|nr:unnamed protein product [Amoebophrya sp. A25]|eukprot:GSA25T00017905001.1
MADDGLETIAVEDLTGVWLHSNRTLGRVVVRGATAKLGKLSLPLSADGNTVAMRGWRAVPERSCSSEIVWQATSGSGMTVTWSWEGDEEELEQVDASLSAAMASIAAGATKRTRRPAAAVETDLIIRNPSLNGTKLGGGKSSGGEKRRRGLNGAPLTTWDLLEQHGGSSSSSERDHAAADAAREFKKWMFTTNTLDFDRQLSSGPVAKRLDESPLASNSQREEFRRRMQQGYGIDPGSIDFEPITGVPTVTITVKTRSDFKAKFPEQWAAKAKSGSVPNSEKLGPKTPPISPESMQPVAGPSFSGPVDLQEMQKTFSEQGGSMSEAEAVERLRRLTIFPMTVEKLRASLLGKAVNEFCRKTRSEKARREGEALVARWRVMYQKQKQS